MILPAVFGLALLRIASPQDAGDDLLCPCLWYDSATCGCKDACALKCSRCDGKGEACRCVADLRKKTGTIKGALKSPYARRVEGVVYLAKVAGKFVLPRKNPSMDQKNKVFTPHVLPVLIGSTVSFPNTDDVRHNVYTEKGAPYPFDLGEYAAGVVKHVRPDKLCVLSLRCHVHAEMQAYLLVLPNPYFATTDKKGGFVIRNVPPGTYSLTFFHEKLRPKTIEVTVGAGKESTVDFTRLKKRG